MRRIFASKSLVEIPVELRSLAAPLRVIKSPQ